MPVLLEDGPALILLLLPFLLFLLFLLFFSFILFKPQGIYIGLVLLSLMNHRRDRNRNRNRDRSVLLLNVLDLLGVLIVLLKKRKELADLSLFPLGGFIVLFVFLLVGLDEFLILGPYHFGYLGEHTL